MTAMRKPERRPCRHIWRVRYFTDGFVFAKWRSCRRCCRIEMRGSDLR